mmetsp:Transcript_54898/g.122796  ORF Transcript_54898/g.122796 Transcript_54898/m.122796 type:complete len:239 (-) Transcript_54898:64-780(-)
MSRVCWRHVIRLQPMVGQQLSYVRMPSSRSWRMRQDISSGKPKFSFELSCLSPSKSAAARLSPSVQYYCRSTCAAYSGDVDSSASAIRQFGYRRRDARFAPEPRILRNSEQSCWWQLVRGGCRRARTLAVSGQLCESRRLCVRSCRAVVCMRSDGWSAPLTFKPRPVGVPGQGASVSCGKQLFVCRVAIACLRSESSTVVISRIRRRRPSSPRRSLVCKPSSKRRWKRENMLNLSKSG